MNAPALILLGAAAVIGLIAVVVDAIIVRRYRALRTRGLVHQLEDRVAALEADLCHAEAERDDISAELDEVYGVAAAMVVGLRSEALCLALDTFFDEELDAAQADAFRGHLATCERCQRVLHGRMQEHVAATRSRCDDRIAFIDGELDAAGAAAFRAHLLGCEACRQALPEEVHLAARLSTLEPEATP